MIEELASRAYGGDLERALLDCIQIGLTTMLRNSHINIHHCLKGS